MQSKPTLQQVVILKSDRAYRDILRREVHRLWPDAEVLTFERGSEALNVMQERAVDLFICGVKIVDMDGLEHLEPFVEKSTKIVVVTTRGDERTFRLLKQVRFNAVYNSCFEGLDRLPTC